MNIKLKVIPHKTKNFILEWEKETNNCEILAQRFDNSKHTLHKNINFDLAVKTITQYILIHKGMS